MVEHNNKLLPSSTASQEVDKPVVSVSLETETKPVVYGRDLNTSDMLLLGPNNALAKIFIDEYSLNSAFECDYSETFSTTSQKVIVDDGIHHYFIKEKPKYCCTPYNLSLSAQFQAFLSER